MGYYISEGYESINIQETIIAALLAADLRTVPGNVRYLSNLIWEKTQVFLKLQQTLASAGVHFEPEFYEKTYITARNVFRAILDGNPETAGVGALRNGKLRDAAYMIEKFLDATVNSRYCGAITQQLLHLEFLDDQIIQLLQEIEKEAHQLPTRQSPPLTWEESFTLVEPAQDVNQAATPEVSSEAGFYKDQNRQKITIFNTRRTYQLS